jgi:hypothetical protein
MDVPFRSCSGFKFLFSVVLELNIDLNNFLILLIKRENIILHHNNFLKVHRVLVSRLFYEL